MSTDDCLAVARRIYDAFARRDIPAFLALLSEDIDWSQPTNVPIPTSGAWPGLAGVQEWLRRGNEAEEIAVLEPREFIGTGETVAVYGHTIVVARPTGRRYATDFVHWMQIREGKIVRFQEFFDTYAAAQAFAQDVVA